MFEVIKRTFSASLAKADEMGASLCYQEPTLSSTNCLAQLPGCGCGAKEPAESGLLMVLAFSDAATAAALRDGPGHSPEMAAMLACRYRPSLPVTEPLRDDFAPVERFALSLLRRP